MAALVFRALIPAGFMPTQGENGRIVMELCAGFDTKTVLVDLDDDASSTSSQLFEHSPCGFTAAALAALPVTPASFPVSLSLHERPVVADIPVATAPSIQRTQSPRGPPLA